MKYCYTKTVKSVLQRPIPHWLVITVISYPSSGSYAKMNIIAVTLNWAKSLPPHERHIGCHLKNGLAVIILKGTNWFAIQKRTNRLSFKNEPSGCHTKTDQAVVTPKIEQVVGTQKWTKQLSPPTWTKWLGLKNGPSSCHPQNGPSGWDSKMYQDVVTLNTYKTYLETLTPNAALVALK